MSAPKNKVVYYPTSEKPLTAQEMAHAMAQLGKRDALWLALMQLLQIRLASAVSDAINHDPHAAGRLAEITELQEQIKSYRDTGLGIKKQSGE